MPRFPDRTEAGRQLAARFRRRTDLGDVVVLALPRGGLPVAFEIAKALNAPLDVFLVRKLGVPGQEELAMGAVASGGVRVMNDDVLGYLNISDGVIEAVVAQELRELERRERAYRGGRPAANVAGRTVIVVDDGLATGATMRAGVKALRGLGASRVIVAVPVAPREAYEEFQQEMDEIVCLSTPSPFWAIGQWYEDFSQLTDEEVCDYLDRAAG
jgi:putative phosphoribosyl transferase